MRVESLEVRIGDGSVHGRVVQHGDVGPQPRKGMERQSERLHRVRDGLGTLKQRGLQRQPWPKRQAGGRGLHVLVGKLHRQGHALHIRVGTGWQVVVRRRALEQRDDIAATVFGQPLDVSRQELRRRLLRRVRPEVGVNAALDQHGFERLQLGLVVLPGGRRQSGLATDLLQERFRVPVVLHRHDREQESARLLVVDRQAMPSHADRLHTRGTHLGDRLEFVQQRHIDLQVGQLGGGNGRQSHIVRGGPMGGTVQRFAQRHGWAQETATCAEVRSALERHKRAGDGMLCSAR